MISDWHGARVSKVYKNNFDDTFRKVAMELVPTIKGTSERVRYYGRPRCCPDCGAGLLKGPAYIYCPDCLYRE